MVRFITLALCFWVACEGGNWTGQIGAWSHVYRGWRCSLCQRLLCKVGYRLQDMLTALQRCSDLPDGLDVS